MAFKTELYFSIIFVENVYVEWRGFGEEKLTFKTIDFSSKAITKI